MDKGIKRAMFIFIAVLFFGMLLGCTYYLHKEYKEAKEFCDSVKGTFKYQIKSPTQPYFCNNEPILHFFVSDGINEPRKFWGFNDSWSYQLDEYTTVNNVKGTE